MIGTLYILLLPLFSLLGNSKVLISSTILLWLINYFRNYNLRYKKIILILPIIAYIIFLFSNESILISNMNIYSSLILISITSNNFISINLKKGREKRNISWIRISILILSIITLINRFIYPYITLEEVESGVNVLSYQSGGWSRDGLFGANIVSLSLVFLNLASLRKNMIFENILSLFIIIIYQGRLSFIILLSIIIYKIINYFEIKNNFKRSTLYLFSLLALIVILFGQLAIDDVNITNKFSRCNNIDFTEVCNSRLEKNILYLNYINRMPIKDIFIGSQSNDISINSDITLSDNSYLETIQSTGIFTFLILSICNYKNIVFSYKYKRYGKELFLIDLLLILILGLYTIIRIIPVIMIYAGLRANLYSEKINIIKDPQMKE